MQHNDIKGLRILVTIVDRFYDFCHQHFHQTLRSGTGHGFDHRTVLITKDVTKIEILLATFKHCHQYHDFTNITVTDHSLSSVVTPFHLYAYYWICKSQNKVFINYGLILKWFSISSKLNRLDPRTILI